MSQNKKKSACSQVALLIRKERLRQNLSMTALAEQAGLSQQSVSYIEREMRIPNLETLLRIAKVLKIDLGDLITQACHSDDAEMDEIQSE
jgi:transcriptional regulator with XRE-family HTH domain